MSINLVDHRQEVIGLLAFSPVNLVEPDRLDALQLPVLQTPPYKPFHRSIHRLPTRLEHLGRLPPAQAPCPTSQESHHRRRLRSLAGAPRKVLDHHPVLGTFHPPRNIDQPS